MRGRACQLSDCEKETLGEKFLKIAAEQHKKGKQPCCKRCTRGKSAPSVAAAGSSSSSLVVKTTTRSGDFVFLLCVEFYRAASPVSTAPRSQLSARVGPGAARVPGFAPFVGIGPCSAGMV